MTRPVDIGMKKSSLLQTLLDQAQAVSTLTHGGPRREPRTGSLAIAEHLLSSVPWPWLAEASVRRPPRSRIWVAVYTGATPGTQVVRSTGHTNRVTALMLAKKWEAEARRERAERSRSRAQPSTRGRRFSSRAGGVSLTQKEVAALLKMSERGVRAVERRALEKLRKDPRLRQLWLQYLAGDLEEQNQAPAKRVQGPKRPLSCGLCAPSNSHKLRSANRL